MGDGSHRVERVTVEPDIRPSCFTFKLFYKARLSPHGGGAASILTSWTFKMQDGIGNMLVYGIQTTKTSIRQTGKQSTMTQSSVTPHHYFTNTTLIICAEALLAMLM